MAFKKVLAGASLALLALAATPAAYAQNDSPTGTTVTPRPHKTVDPAVRAARKAKREQRRQARLARQQRQGQGQTFGGPQTLAPAPN